MPESVWNPSPIQSGTRIGEAWLSQYALDVKPRVFVLTDISNEPDDEDSIVRWWVYPEASTRRDSRGRTFPSDVKLSIDKGVATTPIAPVVKKDETVHVICEVKDSGQPALWSYRRAIIHLQP